MLLTIIKPPVVHTEHPFVPARSHRQANKLLSDWNLRPRGKSSIVGEFGIDDVCDNDVWSYDGWTNAFLEESVTQVLLDRQSTDRRAFALKQEMKDELSDLATRANLPPTKILDGEQIALRDMKATRQKYGAPYSAPPKLSAWSSAIQKVHFATKPDSNVGIGAEDAPEVDDVIEISVVQDALEPRCESKYNGIAKVPMSLRNVLVRTERDSLLNDIPGPVDGKSWEVPLLKKVERDYQVAKMQWKSYCIARQTSNAITQNHRERRGLSIPGITSDDDDFKEVFRRAYDPSEPPSKSDLERFMEVAIENGRRARDSRSQGQTTTQMTAVRRPFRQIPECVLPSHPIYVKAEGEWGAVLEKRKRFGRRWHVFSEQHKDLLVFVAEGGNSDTNATIPPPVLPPREETKSQVKAVKHVFFSVEQLARRAAHPDSWLGDGAVVSDGETDSDTDDRFIIKPVGKQYGTSCRTPAPEMLSQLDRKDSKVSHKEQAQMQGACARAGKISTDNEEESRTRPPPASKPPVKPLSYGKFILVVYDRPIIKLTKT